MLNLMILIQSSEFQDAKYKIIMLHNPLHSLGENAIPPYTDPIQKIEKNTKGEITAIRYEYPKNEDFLIRDIEPLFTQYGVDLVLCGHTHIWNRFWSPAGINHLETSNVGNSYGGYVTIIAVTKRSPQIRESVHAQLMDNGIDLTQSAIIAGDAVLELDGGTYYKGVLHAQSD